MTKDAKNVFDYSGKKKIWFLISLALIAVIIVVTIIKKNNMVKIRSGNEEVFNSGIPRLPVLLNFPITYLHTF